MRFIGPEALPRLGAKQFRAGVEMVLVALLAIQAARLVWIVAAPLGPLGESRAASAPASESKFSALTRSNPFASRDPSAGTMQTASVALSGFHLYGVRAGDGGAGSAIIGREGASQKLYAVGEDVAPGLVLTAVAPDHAVLLRGGASFRLGLLAAPASGSSPAAIPNYLTPAPAAAAAPAAPVAIDAKKLFEEAGLRPHTENGQIKGYTLLPRGDGEMVRKAGLQSGDILVALNGNRITPERYSELEQELVGAREVQLTVQRGTETRTITLQTGR